MADLRQIITTIRDSKGPVALQRLSLKVGKDLNRLAAENGTLDSTQMNKLIAEARLLGIPL
jgi:phage FluMu protein gp41